MVKAPHLPCPCGSKQPLSSCCAIFHAGQPAPTAQALMRSRYAAYVLGLNNYLWQTWHSETRPHLDDLGGTCLIWIQLTIADCQQGLADDSQGEVSFAASYVQNKKGKCLQETSLFEREHERWVYVRGHCQVNDIARNQPCPCASGKKFKHCCIHVESLV